MAESSMTMGYEMIVGFSILIQSTHVPLKSNLSSGIPHNGEWRWIAKCAAKKNEKGSLMD